MQHVKHTDIPNRQFFALGYYVEDDKEWQQDPDAWTIFRQLSQREQDHSARPETVALSESVDLGHIAKNYR